LLVFDDDSSDFSSYEMDDESFDENDEPSIKSPVYIRQCLKLLQDKKDFRKVESALNSVSILIRKNPDDLGDVVLQLCSTLLHLTNEYKLLDFERLKKEGLISLVVICPVLSCKLLGEKFDSKNFSIKQHLDILEVVLEAGREVSKKKKNEISGMFYWPFVNNNMRSKDFIIQSKLVSVMGSIIDWQIPGVEKEKMAKTYLEMIWSLRWRKEQSIKLSCILGTTIVLLGLSPRILAEDFVFEVEEGLKWFARLSKQSRDEKVFKTASICLNQLAKHFS